ncbi:MAG: hypothetical protein QOJ84_3663 [Bradyrhizobium sp.]|jgi:hypothetical protein|nr:hypothetical protein [Bradyrhizobium sp.]
MSASLIVILPIVLLGIVGIFCFTGCILDDSGFGKPFNQYSDLTVLSNSNLVAYWPLSDNLTGTENPAPALERQSGIPSSYIDMTTAPELYPWPPFTIPDPPGPDVVSDGAPGTIAFGQQGLVAGDSKPDLPGVLMPCVVVNGCYVEAPFVDKLMLPTSFTVEAWVRPDWTSNDPDAWRFVVDGRDVPGKGFALLAKNEDGQPGVYRWAGFVGNGGSGSEGFSLVTTTEGTISLGTSDTPAKPVYLALTYDGLTQLLTLFVDGQQLGQAVAVPYMPNTAQPIWIGAGAPYLPRRPQPDGVLSSPLFPFVGAMQDVALYSVALTPADITTHFHNGSGLDP